MKLCTLINVYLVLQSSQRIVIHTEESEGMTDIAIQKLSMEDSAVYTLTAENSAGRSQLSFNLRVVGKFWIRDKGIDVCQNIQITTWLLVKKKKKNTSYVYCKLNNLFSLYQHSVLIKLCLVHLSWSFF